MILLNSNLQAFLTVQEQTTVHGAARKLGLSQTAVTQRIQALERELGISLFVRSRKGMRLTREGEFLLRYCLEFRNLEGKALAELKGEEAEIDLGFAGPTSFMSGRAAPQCRDIYRKWSKVNLRLIVDDSENRLGLLKTGETDLVILAPHQVPLELDSKLIEPDEYILVATSAWRRRPLKEILEDERIFAFHPEDATSLNYLRKFGLLKYLKRSRLYVNENRALTTLLEAGAGFGILTRQIAGPLLKNGSLIQLNENKVMKDPLALAWYPRREMPDYMREIIHSIK